VWQFNEQGGPRAWRIEHKCLSITGGGYLHWWPWTYSVENRGHICSYCKESAPDGLQAVFWMLNEEEEA
jgi:hypothetical protein